MGFESIPTVEDAQFYLDVAFRRAKKTAHSRRSNLKDPKKDKSRKIELAKVGTARDVLVSRLDQLVEKFPSFDQLTPFYKELVKLTLDYDATKQALGHVNKTARQIQELGNKYQGIINNAEKIDEMNRARKAFYGRASSVMEELDDSLSTLKTARKEMVDYPVVKDMPTVAITGFPNVGKTTLLKKLTGSEPEIKAYAFTTKKLNFGYEELEGVKVQFIDTPGTLARPEKMNIIERQSYLAMRTAADILVYVWDLTEPFSMEDQKRLYERVKDLDMPVIEYASKEDIVSEERMEKFLELKPEVVDDVEELEMRISENINSLRLR